MSTSISSYPGLGSESRALFGPGFDYLLLITHEIEYLTYRPPYHDGNYVPAYAPSVLELIQQICPVGPHAWLWKYSKDEEMSELYEHGPLLVEVADKAELLGHAVTTWMPMNAAIALDAPVGLPELADHFTSLLQFSLPDQRCAIQKFNPDHLAAWLQALDEDHREAWLGPVTRAAWRVNLGPAHRWQHFARSAGAARTRYETDMALRDHEQIRLDEGTREHFVLGLAYELQATPRWRAHSLSEARQWIEDLIPQLHDVNFRSNDVVAHFFRLAGPRAWLLKDAEALDILHDLTDSPQGRLHEMEVLINRKEPQHD